MTNFMRTLKIRTRFILILCLVGLIPLGVTAFFGIQMIGRMEAIGRESNQAVLVQAREAAMVARVKEIGRLVSQYQVNHPEVDFSNPQALQTNVDLVAVAAQKIGETGSSMVYNSQGTVLFASDPNLVGTNLETYSRENNLLYFWQIVSLSLTGTAGKGEYQQPDSAGNLHFYNMWAEQVNASGLRVALMMDSEELKAPFGETGGDFDSQANRIHIFFLMVSLVASLLVIGMAFILGREQSTKIRVMAANARMVARNLTDQITLPSHWNELETIHQAFMEVSRLVRDLRTNLDKQLTIRTADLARHSMRIDTAVQVASEAATTMDIEKLLEQTPKLIASRFGFYHAGVFLVDPGGEYAILQSSNSEGGKRMLAQGHKIKMGGAGLVGRVTQTGQPLVVEDVSLDDIHLHNPELPGTCSELAIPMKVHGQIIGVLDVQATEPDAFTDDDLKILVLVADQIGLAIMNARLLHESQQAQRELNSLYGQQARNVWRKRIGSQPLAYAFTPLSLEQTSLVELEPQSIPVIKQPQISEEENAHKLAVPIRLRDQLLGSILLSREADQEAWSREELELMEDLASQFANALENARLMETIQRQTQQVRLVGEIAAKAQSSLDLETVLRTSVEEIGMALRAARVQIRLGGEAETAGGNGQHRVENDTAQA